MLEFLKQKTKLSLSMQLELPIENCQKATPFLRWAGGKSWFTKKVDKFIPKRINNYIEPFLGGGAIFFHLGGKFKSQFLSDVNEDLIITYSVVRDDVASLIKELRKYKNDKEHYYKIRELKHSDPIKRAAQFIYLNKTSFNGIYRVNRLGQYNVPYGNNEKAIFLNTNNLLLASKALENAQLSCQDFEDTIRGAKKGDFVFIDPPYTVAHENNGFISYNQKLFTIDDQKRLAEAIEKLDRKGAYYLLTNAKHSSIKEIYKRLGSPTEMQRTSLVGGKNAMRGVISEYVFTNTK